MGKGRRRLGFAFHVPDGDIIFVPADVDGRGAGSIFHWSVMWRWRILRERRTGNGSSGSLFETLG